MFDTDILETGLLMWQEPLIENMQYEIVTVIISWNLWKIQIEVNWHNNNNTWVIVDCGI